VRNRRNEIILQPFRLGFRRNVAQDNNRAKLLISFAKQVSRKLGSRVLWNMISGKYYKPRTEERVFLFIDLKASTTYAEELGHLRFSSLIQDCFYHLARVVKQYQAEVYQYVGDEVVLTWCVQNGRIPPEAIKTFFAFEHVIQQKAAYYNRKYGFVPVFKGGKSPHLPVLVSRHSTSLCASS